MILKDRFGRVIETIRISVTDRCNFKCMYCSIDEDTIFLPRESIMSFEEIVEITRILAQMGIKRVKLTGGEPLIRKNITELVKNLAAIKEIKDLSLTTNGSMLTKKMVYNLKRAGLHRLNISLDSLNPETFRLITGGDKLERVLEGIENSLKAGFKTVKINTVLIKGINDTEILDLFNFAKNNNLTLRFIEEMPLSAGSSKGIMGVSNDDVFNILKDYLVTDSKITGDIYPGPAVTFKIKGGSGRIGFISPISHPFCSGCNRIRLTTSGKLLPCISRNEGLNILQLMRNRVDTTTIKKKIQETVFYRKFSHNGFTDYILMNRLGG